MRTAACQSAPGASAPYERRRPEETTLYHVVQDHVETFFAQVEQETGTGLPKFVKDEFDAFLECGILAHGFLRLRCGECAHEKLVAFSCKRRGFCPAFEPAVWRKLRPIWLNRSSRTYPYAIGVVSFPIPLRHLFATQPHLLSPVLQVIHRALAAPYAGLVRLRPTRFYPLVAWGGFQVVRSTEHRTVTQAGDGRYVSKT